MSTKTDIFIPLNVSILTVSDTRDRDSDTSGLYLEEQAHAAGHTVLERRVVMDDIYVLRATVSAWIAEDERHVIICTGGTGFTQRDSTPEALSPLFDKTIDGFGELFRQLSISDIGTSTVQSRCVGGIANQTLIFCLPGSTGACKTGWEGILSEQLDSRHRPCNFVTHTRAWENYTAHRDGISN